MTTMIAASASKFNYKDSKRRPTVLVLDAAGLFYRNRRRKMVRIDLTDGGHQALGMVYGPCTLTFARVATSRPDMCFSVVNRERTFDFELSAVSVGTSWLLRFLHKVSASTGVPTTPGSPHGLVSRLNRMQRQLATCADAASARAWFQELDVPDRHHQVWPAHLPCHTCAVCLEPCTADVAELRCRHAFHADCIRPWLATGGSCPVCRAKAD